MPIKNNQKIINKRISQIIGFLAEKPRTIGQLVDLVGIAHTNLLKYIKSMQKIELIRIDKNVNGRTTIVRLPFKYTLMIKPSYKSFNIIAKYKANKKEIKKKLDQILLKHINSEIGL